MMISRSSWQFPIERVANFGARASQIMITWKDRPTTKFDWVFRGGRAEKSTFFPFTWTKKVGWRSVRSYLLSTSGMNNDGHTLKDETPTLSAYFLYKPTAPFFESTNVCVYFYLPGKERLLTSHYCVTTIGLPPIPLDCSSWEILLHLDHSWGSLFQKAKKKLRKSHL